MAKRDNHYEAAFEAYLRDRRLPYVAVDEAKRSRLSDGSLKSLDFLVSPNSGDFSETKESAGLTTTAAGDTASFNRLEEDGDGFVTEDWGDWFSSGDEDHSTCDSVGQTTTAQLSAAVATTELQPPARDASEPTPPVPSAGNRKTWLIDVKGRRFPAGRQKQYWKNWSTWDDVISMSRWQRLFGPGAAAMFVFAYEICGDRSPLPAEELFRFRSRIYGFVGIELTVTCGTPVRYPKPGERWPCRQEFFANRRHH